MTDMSLGRDSDVRRFDSVVDLIGTLEQPTPLVRLGRVIPEGGLSTWLKLEWMNPFGSIKDRTARFLLEGLQESGHLDGKEIVEPTSGNTGIALVALANLLGVRSTITVPDGVPKEKQDLLRLLGAKVWATPDDLCPIDHPKDGAIALARSIDLDANTGHRFVMPNQYENPDNIRAHYETTGPEIWRQTAGKVRYVFAGYGTCGTLTGIGRYLKEQNPDVRVIAIEPQRGHRLPGLKNFAESKKPCILDESVIDDVVRVDDGPAYDMTIRLIREESLFVGPSTGAIIHAVSQYKGIDGACAVAVSPDSVFKYVSYLAEYLETRPELIRK